MRRRTAYRDTWAFGPVLSPAGSSRVTDSYENAFLCHSYYEEETKGVGAVIRPRRAVSTGTVDIGYRFRSEPGTIHLFWASHSMRKHLLKKEGLAFLCPASGAPGPTPVSSKSCPHSPMSPFQVGPGGRYRQRERARTRAPQLQPLCSLKPEVAHFLSRTCLERTTGCISALTLRG